MGRTARAALGAGRARRTRRARRRRHALGVHRIGHVLLLPRDLLLEPSLHISRLLLNLLHLFAPLEFFFFHLADEVFFLFLVAGHEGSLLFLTVTLLSLDRLDQVPDLLLQLVSLFLLDEDLNGHVGQLSLELTFVLALVNDREDC